VTGLLVAAIMMGTPLLLGSLAEVYVERTGVMNTAIEGTFLMGAWAAFVVTYTTHNLWLGLAAAIVAGVFTTLIYGVICIYLGQDQVVVGTAINILAMGLTAFLFRAQFGTPLSPLTVDPFPKIPIPVLSQIPVLGPALFEQNLLTYSVYVIAPLMIWVLHRTSLGLTVRSAGENPTAVDVAGIDVKRVRLLTVSFAGVLCGIAGAFYSIGFLGLFTETMIGGRGWIAFAICFLGNWSPRGAVLGTLVFGLAEAIAIQMQSSGALIIPNEVFIGLPYVLTIVLTVARKTFNVPEKLGVAYAIES